MVQADLRSVAAGGQFSEGLLDGELRPRSLVTSQQLPSLQLFTVMPHPPRHDRSNDSDNFKMISKTLSSFKKKRSTSR